MGNLSELLTNPSTPDQTLQALVTAVLEDEAAGGSAIGGSGSAGFLPLFETENTLANSPIDYGVSAPDTLTITADGTGGLVLECTGGPLVLAASAAGVVYSPPLLIPQTPYSTAGTPLPDPTTVAPGTEATVSDALLPTYMGAYQSGGAVVCKVITDGATGWFTLSGSTTTPPKNVSASYAADPADSVILYSGVMDGSQAITLPTASKEARTLAAGKIMTVKVISTDAGTSALNVATSNAAEYAGNPQLSTKPAGAAMGGVASLVWDGSAWWLLEYSQ
jgi:hypothetical protein